jgi:hypothetical protein
MIFPTLADSIQGNNNLFDCVSTHNEYRVKATTTMLLGYMVTENTLSESIRTFDYVHGLYIQHNIAFAPNQSSVIMLSAEMFSQSRSLSAAESHILDLTFNQMLKTKPTLPGRK